MSMSDVCRKGLDCRGLKKKKIAYTYTVCNIKFRAELNNQDQFYDDVVSKHTEHIDWLTSEANFLIICQKGY